AALVDTTLAGPSTAANLWARQVLADLASVMEALPVDVPASGRGGGLVLLALRLAMRHPEYARAVELNALTHTGDRHEAILDNVVDVLVRVLPLPLTGIPDGLDSGEPAADD
ncbi:MAG: hypothetical protein KGK07_13565, partial [Chloroflexota bacterium]|nr:hypothetical protein [Chloroflexota bacterium]